MSLDADPDVVGVASQPMGLHWVTASGRAKRHAPDFFVRRADGTGLLVDFRPDTKMSAEDAAVFADTAALAGQVGWDYRRVGRRLSSTSLYSTSTSHPIPRSLNSEGDQVQHRPTDRADPAG
jgi:hypothetical protein